MSIMQYKIPQKDQNTFFMEDKQNKLEHTFRHISRFSKLNLAVFAVIFAGLGSYFLFFSHAASSYDGTILADHPVAYWAMNSTSATETDLTGNGHNGSYCSESSYEGGRGTCPASFTPSLDNMLNGDQAAKFNETSCSRSGSTYGWPCQYMKVADADPFSITTTGQLTVEAWLKPNVLQMPFGTGGSNNTDYIEWAGKCETYSPTCEWEGRMYNAINSQYRCDMLDGYVFNSGGGYGQSADWQPAGANSNQIPAYTDYGTANCTQSILQANQWLHVVIEYDTTKTPSWCSSSPPGAVYIWVNGVQENYSKHSPSMCMDGQYKITPGNYASPVTIGTEAHDAFFDGAIGKVAIYDSLLSQTQINNHFTAMTGAAVAGSCGSHGDCSIPVPTQTGSINPAPTVNFAANPTTIAPGDSSTLTWSTSNADSCSANAPSGFSISGTSGTQSVTPAGTTTYTISCTGAGGTTPASATVTVSSGGSCSTSSTTWQNTGFAAQTASFTFEFDATPSASGVDAVTGLSNGSATDFTSLAAIVRFNNTNTIDVRNAGNYTADTSVPYTAGTSYHFKLTVNPATHTYTVVVTPAGGSATTIATNYAFRTEQATLSTFNNWADYSDVGSEQVCNAVVATVTTPVIGDINGDGHVNITDLSLLLSSYGSSSAACVTNSSYTCDLNGSGKVDITDLSILLSHYTG